MPRVSPQKSKSAAPDLVPAAVTEAVAEVVLDEVVSKFGPGVPTLESLPKEMTTESKILYHVFILNSVLERAGNRVTEAHGLTLPQWMALGCVSSGGEPGVTHSELGHLLMLSKAPITGVVDRLERAGYVRREVSASDRRVSRIHVTPSGDEVWRNVRAALRELAVEQCDVFLETEKEQFLGLLSRFLHRAAASDPMLAWPPCASREAKIASADAAKSKK